MVSKWECRIVIVFLMCLLKIVNIRAQCEKPSLGENRILTPESDKSSYPDGSTATFKCSVGYTPLDLRASRSITCTGNTWTDLALQCKKKSCGALSEISNGKYYYSPEGADGILFGATATAKCNQGYVLYGKADRLCRDEGWDGRDPACEVVKCVTLPVVENGRLIEPPEEEYSYQAVVTYTCNDGYFMSGEASVSCLENGSFSTPPQCKKVLCGDLEIDPNAERSGAKPPYKLGSFVQFQCKKGYTLKGSNYLRCEPSGWSQLPPQCLAPTTGQPTKATTPRTPTRPTRPQTTKAHDIVQPPSPNPPPDQHNHGWKIAVGITVPLVILDLWIIPCLLPSLSVLLLS